MVRAPSANGPDAKGIENRTQLLHDLGVLVTLWSQLELHIEVEIARITGMSFHHASIVLGTLQHKAKTSILYSLLRTQERTDVIPKIKAAINFAKRNALMHSAMATEADFSKFVFFSRTMDDAYKVKALRYTAEEFHQHVYKFRDLANVAIHHLSIPEEELGAYGKAALFDLQGP